MQKNKNRQGLALGAVFAMVASLVVMTSPAQASESSVVAYPNTGLVTQTTVPNGDAFDLALRFGTGVQASYRATDVLSSPLFGITVTKPAAVEVNAVVTGAGASGSADVRDAGANLGDNTAGSTSTTVETAGTSAVFVVNSSLSPVIALSLTGRTSISASVAITVTTFLDLNANGAQDAGEPSGNTTTITFVPLSALGATLSLAQPLVGDSGSTASFAITANNAVNWNMVTATFTIRMTSSSITTTSGVLSGAELANSTLTKDFSTGVITTGSARAYSASFSVGTVPFVALATVSADVLLGTVVVATATTLTATTLGVLGTVISFSATANNIAYQSAGNANGRFNSAFTLDAYPFTASSTQAAAVASAFTVSALGSAMDFGPDSGVILNGKTYTSSAALLAAGFTLASGTKTVEVSTFGQVDSGTATNEFITFKLSAQLEQFELKITLQTAIQTVAYAGGSVAGLAGAAKTFAVTAKDQWGVASARTDQRIAASVVLGGSTSPVAIGAVVNGAATVVVTPTPAARTGSAVVTFRLQTFDQGTQAWVNTGNNGTAAWNLYTYAAGTDSITSRTVSKSASISYGVALSWSQTIAVVIANSFSDVVASAPGLMIQNADSTTVTASNALTIAANGKTANFRFTSRLAGTYTVTFTNGTATTTSTIIVDAAGHDSGATLTFDKTSIDAGTTTTVTGTLKDVNGNPVMTSGSADVSVAWSGKGLPFGNATNMETDAAGQLTFYVLVLSGEVGDAAISATYKPAGATVSTANVSVVVAVAVGKAAATSADQKITIGTYKGYVGVFTKGYEGQKLSVRLASKWHVRNPIVDLNAGYSLLTVNTGVGYVANVIVYIDGVEVKRETITTK